MYKMMKKTLKRKRISVYPLLVVTETVATETGITEMVTMVTDITVMVATEMGVTIIKT